MNDTHIPSDAAAPPLVLEHDTVLGAIEWICRRYGVDHSRDVLTSGLGIAHALPVSRALELFEQAGFVARLVQRPLGALPDSLMPVVQLMADGNAAVVLGRGEPRIGPDDKLIPTWAAIAPAVGPEPVHLTEAELIEPGTGYVILVKPRARIEAGFEPPLPEPAGHWLLRTLWQYRSYYRSAALGAFLINVLGLASVFFTMNVYDRVVPTQAYATLWSLAVGVSLAMVLESVSRHVRAHVLDMAGKKADLVLGSLLFRQAMSIRMEHRPDSSGSFAHRLREFESVRDFATSATLSALSDLPFVLLFAAVIFSVGGPLGWIPVLMIPVIVVLGLIVQWPLASAMRMNQREAAMKTGVLIESIEGLETLKAVGGDGVMRSRWDAFSAKASASSMRSRQLSSLASMSVAFLQQMQTVVLVIAGVYLIGEGKLTQGALIGSVMLAGRVTAPLGQVMGLALRFQQARTALRSLNELMALPVDHAIDEAYLSRPALSGHVQLSEVGFAYPQKGPQEASPVLNALSLEIRAGEKVAILGRVGSGKSTLLRLIARLYRPTSGKLLADGLDAAQIAPADWRAAFGYVGQDCRLFSGSLRENLLIGRPDASPQEMLRVLQLTGLDVMVASHPLGLHLPVGEHGGQLSGGQRQLVALARSLLTRPRALLLDEPTSAMDTQTESQFIERLRASIGSETLVVVTHRPSLLALVDRIVVVDHGAIVMDGPKQKVLAALTGDTRPAGPPASPAEAGGRARFTERAPAADPLKIAEAQCSAN
ncbi:MAG: type I secretion system permease/ATPase [Burkholderia sp.]